MARDAAAKQVGMVPGEAAPVAASDSLMNRIRDDFEEFGLNGYQARVLLALLRAGSASPPYLAQLSGVHRTSAYPVLDELATKGLAYQLPGQKATWATPGPEKVLNRLLTTQEERLRAMRARMAETADAIAQVVSARADGAMAAPYVQMIAGAAQARSTYDRLLAEVEDEFLVLNRPPYSAAGERGRRNRALTDIAFRDELNPAVIAALGRGVSIKVLYQKSQWDDAASNSFRSAMSGYHRAGVEGRVVDELPMKLVVADRRVALLSLADPVLPEVGFPANLLVAHPGYAGFQADGFDHRWATGRSVTTERSALNEPATSSARPRRRP